MGHSLDVTDKDIIKELFEQADEITIFYHNIEAKRKYAENLVKIFGKIKFEKLQPSTKQYQRLEISYLLNC